MAEHTFHYEGSWNGGREGKGRIKSGNLSSVISTPASMNGLGEGTNPDELLLGAAGSCFLMTLAFVFERAQIEVKELTVASTGTVSESGGLHFKKIVHRPHILLPVDTDLEKIDALIKKAESRCMVSKALHGNVEILVEPEVETR
ncbi:MAG TPA: OsmC family protein [Bacillales bacterium]|nr:OsmC family protein [Bacillales bacterium]